MQNKEITPNIALQIFSNANSNGVTVEIYLKQIISDNQKVKDEEPMLTELLKDLTGKIASSKSNESNSNEFGKARENKFEKQGLKTS